MEVILKYPRLFDPTFELILLCLGSVLSVGCASQRGGEAPASYLSPSPGHASLSVSDYIDSKAYTAAVEEQLRKHRVPFDANQTELEIERAKPMQFDPVDGCLARSSRGIVILVHGLSDTAFAMSDVAKVAASNCFVARTVLLPGHGTRPGDLLVTDLSDWRKTLRELVQQAASEHETVVLGGFSLGAVLALSSVLEKDSPVDAVMAFSPAYTLSSYKLARYAPYLHLLKRWIDRGLPDDYLRYEAMPTRGVAETVNAMKLMHRQLRKSQSVDIPWLMVQSMDDAVILPNENMQIFKSYARHPASKIINFYTDQNTDDPDQDRRTSWLRGDSDDMRVLGITHAGVANSPNNPHYGLNSDYRNCGQTARRVEARVQECLQSDKIWYGLWNKPKPANLPTAINTFNPQFDVLAQEIATFLDF